MDYNKTVSDGMWGSKSQLERANKLTVKWSSKFPATQLSECKLLSRNLWIVQWRWVTDLVYFCVAITTYPIVDTS